MTTNFEFDISKQLAAASSNGWNLQEMHEAIPSGDFRKPRLLTYLMGGLTSTAYSQTPVFQFDITQYTPQLVSGKAYDERGNVVTKDKSTTKYYQIPSKGIRTIVKPADVQSRRKAGTMELMSVEELNAEQVAKAIEAFDIERELEYAQLLTAGTNRVAGGPFTSYNFHLDILGTARPSATPVDFTAATDPRDVIAGEVEKLQDKAAKYGLTVSNVVAICGKGFFDDALAAERMENFGRELRSAVDLASMGVPTLAQDNFYYKNFDSNVAGVTFVKYTASVAGTKMVADDKAYLIPVLSGVSLVKEVYAPAETLTDVNKPARELYSWMHSDNFVGIANFFEQNKLSMLPRPDLIVELVVA